MTRRSGLFLVVPLALAALLVALLASCGPGEQRSGSRVPPAVLTPSSPTPAASPPGATPAPDVPVEPEVVSWGGEGGHLAIVVRNQSDVLIRSARVLITGLDSEHRPVLATIGRPDSKCCTALDVGPGEEFGLYVNMRRPVTDLSEVLVRYVELETAPAPSADAPRIEVSGTTLKRETADTVVTATVTTRGDEGPYLAGQAFLVDEKDRLVAVISGHFYCFGPRTRHRLRMHLQRPVPPGTRIQKVLAHSIPRGYPVTEPGACQ